MASPRQIAGIARLSSSTCQLAEYPLVIVCREIGKKAPSKSGCGQATRADTDVVLANGKKCSDSLPATENSIWKLSAPLRSRVERSIGTDNASRPATSPPA